MKRFLKMKASTRFWLALAVALLGGTVAASAQAAAPARAVTAYALTSAQDMLTGEPTGWHLLASNDGQTWDVLDVRKNQSFTSRGQRRVYFIKNRQPYRFYRLQVDANRMRETRGAELAEIEFNGPVSGVDSEADLEAVITSSQEHPLMGAALNAFDAETTSKWVDFGRLASGGCWIQCEYVRHAEMNVTNVNQLRIVTSLAATRILLSEQAPTILSNVIAAAAQPSRKLTGYALTSANDEPARDPRDWRLLGSNDGGKTWDVVDVRRNEVFSTRFQRRVFTLSKPAAYAVFRLQVDSVASPANANSIQVAEVEPLYAAADGQNFSLVVFADSENPPMEKAEMAFDGDSKSKWLSFTMNNSQAHWLQWQSLPEIEGLPLVNLRQLNRLAGRVTAGGPAPELSRLTRTLTGYTLTSADEGPAGDPRDWRLLASNDGGKTWETLDTRRDEAFTARAQKRSFTIAKPAAYALYRFEIGSVAVPTNAESVLLAELEPAYAPDATKTNLSMVVAADGDNPPQEGVERLFDGDADTRWLDYSRRTNFASAVQWYFAANEKRPVIRADAGSGIQPGLPKVANARLEGVAVCVRSNMLGLLDDGGFQMLAFDAPVPAIPAGARVRVAGRLQFGRDIPMLQDSQFTVLGALGEAPEIHAEQSFDGKENFLIASAEGKVTAVSEGRFYSTIRFARENGPAGLLVKILNPERKALPNFADCRLRARGVVETIINETGNKVVGVIWVSGPDDVALAPLTAREWSQCPEWSSTNAAPGQLARVHGIVWQQIPGRQLIVREGTNDVVVYTTQSDAPPVGAEVEVAGFLDKDPATPALLLGYARPAMEEIAPELAKPVIAFDEKNPVTSLHDANEALKNQPDKPFAVKLRGVITYIDLGLSEWYLQDGSESVYVQSQLSAGLSPFLKQEGLYVELRGTVWGTNWYGIKPTDFVTVLGRGRMPEPLRHSWDYLMTGKDDGKWVQLEGVVTAFEKQRLTLSVNGGQLVAWVNEIDRSVQNRLLGSLVRVSGVCSPVTNNRGQRLGVRLLVPSAENVEMVKASPENPFDLPAVALSSVMQSDSDNNGLTIQLVKTAGIVTHKEPRLLFVQQGGDGLRVLTREDTTVEPGDRVEVVGLAEPDGFSPKLVQALVRKTGREPLPKAAAIDSLEGGSVDDSSSHDATRGQVEAVLLGSSVNESTQILELQEGKTKKTFYAYLPLNTDASASIPIGSRLRLAGVFKAKTDTVPDFGQVVTSFEMFLNSPADIAVLETPAWWTARHTLWVLGGLGSVLFVALAWAGLLRNQVRRRTRELHAEIVEHKRTEAQLEAEIAERKRMQIEVEKTHKDLVTASRQAGMAEVATSVLHNVGNVLNSVNISASLVGDHLRQTKAINVGRVAALMREHEADLAAFLVGDSRGRQLPVYLTQLAEYLAQEQTAILKEIELLTKNIEHIKDIVAMQQTYARVAGVTETVQVAELVEDALRMNAGALARHDVRIVRDYATVPPITVDKHKVLQILVNVIRNAKYACDEGTGPEKLVTVRVSTGDERVRIAIVDNGVGIPKENLVKIFNHGFTTRKDGHGFGLHSGALAAQEMGGRLDVHSDGPGLGAVFTLELPAKRPDIE